MTHHAPAKRAKKKHAKANAEIESSPAELVKQGRPSLYREEFVGQVRKLALLGATDEQIADFFDVSVNTIDNWKKTHPDFLGSLKAGKLSADSDVADRLHQRAMGFEYDKAVPIKVKEVTYHNGKRLKETERVEVVMVHEVVPPDTTACIFWLKNRQRDQWRDKQDHQVTGQDGGPIEVEVHTAELRTKLANRISGLASRIIPVVAVHTNGKTGSNGTNGRHE